MITGIKYKDKLIIRLSVALMSEKDLSLHELYRYRSNRDLKLKKVYL
jgi:hypothetical protein